MRSRAANMNTDRLAFEEIVKPTRSSHEEMRRASQSCLLDRDLISSSRHFDKDLVFAILGKPKERLPDLFCELTSWSEDESLDRFLFGVHPGQQG